MTQKKATRPQVKPRSVMLSKRANVFYLEHVRVIQKDGRIVYITEDGNLIERYFNLPERNTAFILLGKGSSITDSAARRLAESNVIVGFCGSGGSPLFSTVDYAFLTPLSEYRPTEYMQEWMRAWLDEERRLGLAKDLLIKRCDIIQTSWAKMPELLQRGLAAPVPLLDKLRHEVAAGASTEVLLLSEARFAKSLYALLANAYRIDFSREEGKGASQSTGDVINGFLDHGNYIAYGYAAVTLNGLGISFSLPLLHGKTRRGALVFDVADLIKDAFVMPMAFHCGKLGESSRDFRQMLIEKLQEEEVLDLLFDFVKSLCEKSVVNQQVENSSAIEARRD